MTLTGRKVLLTGAGGGIGKELAKQLAEQGAQLMLCGRRPEPLQAVLEQLPGSGHVSHCADLGDGLSVDALATAASDWGADGLINNAGLSQLGLLDEVDPAALSEMIDVNLKGPMLLTQALLPHLKQQPRATIVNVGSILGSIGMAGSTVYCAGKFALRGFSEALRRELADSHTEVFYIAPRATDTGFNDQRTRAMNSALGNTVDSADSVAAQLLAQLSKGTAVDRYIGWPEKFFVRLNGLLPRLVDGALKKQLATIKQQANDNK